MEVKIVVTTFTNLTSNAFEYEVNWDMAGPGICSIKPSNGPTGTTFEIKGENLADKNSFEVKFPKAGNLFSDLNETNATWTSVLISNLKVPATGVSGGVYVGNGTKDSNSVEFRVGNCAVTGCRATEQCCDNGSCIAEDDECADVPHDVNPSEFAYVLSTDPLPNIPAVLERSCIVAENISASPLPAKNSGEACPNGIISATFNQVMKWDTFKNNVTVKRCKSAGADCDLNKCEAADCVKAELASINTNDRSENNLEDRKSVV